MDDHAIGHLNDGGIDRSRVSEFVDRISAASEPKCASCMARLVCGGMCHFTLADGKGGFRPPSEVDCEAKRTSLRTAVGYLLELQDLPQDQARTFLKSVCR